MIYDGNKPAYTLFPGYTVIQHTQKPSLPCTNVAAASDFTSPVVFKEHPYWAYPQDTLSHL